MSNEKKEPVIGTSDMPPVQTLKYETYYKVSQIFINDLRLVMQDAAYADLKQFLDFLKSYNYILPVAMLNEFINRLATMPYRTVSPIMEVIENKNLFPKYFEELKPKQPANSQPNKK